MTIRKRLARSNIAMLAIPLAVIIAFSRLYLFVHYPSDILAVPSWAWLSERRYIVSGRAGCKAKSLCDTILKMMGTDAIIYSKMKSCRPAAF